MEKRKFVPELGREVVYDDSYPADYVANYIAQEVAKSAPKPPPKELSILQQMGAFGAGVPNAVMTNIADMFTGAGGVLDSPTIKGYGEDVRKMPLSVMAKNLTKGYEGSTGLQAGEITGQLLSMLGPGMAMKMAKLPGIFGTGQAVAQSVLQSSAEQVHDAQASRDAGMPVSPEQETDAARMGAMIAGPIGMIPYGRFMGKLAPAGLNIAKEAAGRGVAKVAGSALLSGGIEAGTEAGQDVIQDLIKQHIYNAGQPIGENAMASAKAGAGAGLTLDLLMSMLSKGTGKRIMQRREALPSVPVEALQDADSIGIRRGEGGDPLVELLARLQQERPRPGMPAPLMDDVIAATQGGGKPLVKATMPGMPPPLVTEGLPPATLTPEGAITTPSRLAMDQPKERFVAEDSATIPPSPVDVQLPPPEPSIPKRRVQVRPVVAPTEATTGQPVTEAMPTASGVPAPEGVSIKINPKGGKFKVFLADQAGDQIGSSWTYADQKTAQLKGKEMLAEYTPRQPVSQVAELLAKPADFIAPTATNANQTTSLGDPSNPNGVVGDVKFKSDTYWLTIRSSNDGKKIIEVPFKTQEEAVKHFGQWASRSTGAPRFSIDTQPPAPTAYTVESLGQEIQAGKKPEIALDVFGEMQRLGVDDLLSTRLIDSLGQSEGTYSNRIVQLALKGKSKSDLLRILNHEAVHGMKQMGLFNDAEWSLLNTTFNPETSLTEEERTKYGEMYKDQVKVQEEAVARGIERYAAGQINASSEAVSIAAKVLGSIDRLGNVLRGKGFQNTGDVLKAFRTGDIGGREIAERAQYDAGNTNGKGNGEVSQPTQNQQAGKRSTSLANYLTEDQEGEGEDVRQSYVGQKAYSEDARESARMSDSKNVAAQMASAGKSPDSIRLATGWFKSPYDKAWKYEVADHQAALTPEFTNLPESKIFAQKNELQLDRVLDHPELFKAYPELRKVKVIKQGGLFDFFGSLQGSFDPKTNTLNITPYSKDPTSTILHEVQHWIQEKEGFATGGNENMALDALTPERMTKIAGKVLDKKTSELESHAKELTSIRDAVRTAEKYKPDLQVLRQIEEDHRKAWAKYQETQSDQDKGTWLNLHTKKLAFESSLAKKIAGTEADGKFRTFDEAMRLHDINSRTPDNVKQKELQLVKLQKEISDIRSGNPEALKEIIKQSGGAYDAYRNIAGEIEARDVQARQKLTPNERASKAPMTSEEIDPEDVITTTGTSSDTRHSIVPQLPISGNRAFAKPDERGILKKAYDDLTSPSVLTSGPLGSAALRYRQETLDMRAGIAQLGRKAGDTSARTGSEAATRAYDVAQTYAESALTSGPLEYVGADPGDGYFRVSDKPDLAPARIFKQAYDKGKFERLMHYIAAEKSEELLAKRKEHHISPQDIAAWKQYGSDPEIAGYAKRWRQFNDGMLDAVGKSGRFTPAQIAEFKRTLYVPYYRVEEDSTGRVTVTHQSSGSTMGSSPRMKELKGGKSPIADPTDNIVRNVNMLTSMAMQNVAKQRVMRDGIQLNVIEQVPKAIEGAATTKVWVNGKEKIFKIKDQLLYDSINASRIPSSVPLTLFGMLGKVKRDLITMEPVFMTNNMVRDATMVWMQGYTDLPFQRVAQDAIRSVREMPDFKNLERQGVVGAGIRGEGGATGTGRNLRDLYEGKTSVVKWLQEQSRKSEATNRLTVYESVMKRTGGDEAQAAHESRELLNFYRTGGHAWVQWFNAMVPFLNASRQGVDVVWRSAVTGRGANPKMQKQMAMRMAMMGGLAAAYAVLVHDDETWKSMTPEDRDRFWVVPGLGLKLPIPHEAGFVAKVIPERLMAMFLGNDTGKEFMAALKRFAVNSMKADPTEYIPQFVAPGMETAMNYNNFQDRPIEPEHMRKTEKALRYDESTSEMAKAISKHVTPGTLSPLQVDHLTRGYFGTLGVYGTQLISALIEPKLTAARIMDPSKEPSDWPVIGKMFQRPDGPKKIIDFYNIADAAEQAADALKKGEPATKDRIALATAEQALRPSVMRMSTFTKMEKQIRAAEKAGKMTPSQARATLKELRKQKIALAEPVSELRKTLP